MESKAPIRKQCIWLAAGIVAVLLLNGIFAAGGALADLYFHRWYVFISTILRKALGMVPFSIGDVIYIVWVTVAIIFLLRTVLHIIRRQWQELLLRALKGVSTLIWLYFFFLLLWGGHYRRQTLSQDLHFDVKAYTTADLCRLADTLVKLTNRDHAMLEANPDTSARHTFETAVEGYRRAAVTWPRLTYDHTSVKPAIFGKWMNYIGVTGYLNPFTNEAQVNVTVPAFLQPFTTCHEIAHQIGFAPEQDANFVGYITALHAPDSRFRYAANFEMLLYSVRQLARRDKDVAKAIWERTSAGVQNDAHRLILFYKQYQGPLDSYSEMLYDRYLKANRQDQGIRSYSEVVGWLMAYYRI